MGAPRELGQVREKGNHLLSTYYAPGTQATDGIHLFLVAVLKARTHFQEGRGLGTARLGVKEAFLEEEVLG